MKYKLLIMIITATLFQSCCRRGDEISREEFTALEKALIPYQNNQIISLKHNQDYEFEATVTTNSDFHSYFGPEDVQCGDYNSFEVYTVNVMSTIPYLNMDFTLNHGFDDYLYQQQIGLNANSHYFYYDEQMPLETVIIDDVTYENVYRYFSSDNYYSESFISEVLFNKSVGIIKILYDNGEYVQINQ